MPRKFFRKEFLPPVHEDWLDPAEELLRGDDRSAVRLLETFSKQMRAVPQEKEDDPVKTA